VADLARKLAGDVDGSLGLARQLESVAHDMGQDTWTVFSALASLGGANLTTARVVEPHWDAVAIRDQAGASALPDATWGVYAASSPATFLQATHQSDGRWHLSGVKPWCSLADRVSNALVTAAVEGAPPGLFEVEMHQSGITADAQKWAPCGLRDVTTSTVTFEDVPAIAIGAPGWYLERPGFAWGAIGVAAVWFGGAAAIAGSLWDSARRRRPDQLGYAHMGACDAVLRASLVTLREAARAIDAGEADGRPGEVLAARVRAQVAHCAEEVLTVVGHALGPGPLALDPVHAMRVADLTLYVRQHHAERDLAALGQLVAPPTEVLAHVPAGGSPGA
jgi:alkylation response protein AidB-like acyl-CoA dehydrogenase